MRCSTSKACACACWRCCAPSRPRTRSRMSKIGLVAPFPPRSTSGPWARRATLSTNPKRRNRCFRLTVCTPCCKRRCCSTRSTVRFRCSWSRCWSTFRRTF
uniref:(northern house mosquito) hypothetical protein n=1 Tax=Culex pipiens TaxID=7175 RepID=A0A8D8CXF4_CULPI